MVRMASTRCQKCSWSRSHYHFVSQLKCAGMGRWFQVVHQLPLRCVCQCLQWHQWFQEWLLVWRCGGCEVCTCGSLWVQSDALLFIIISSFHEPIQSRGVRRPSVCKLLRKSLLLAGKWPDRHQTCTRWTPGQRTSRVCSRSRSKGTWYGHFCAGTKIASSHCQIARSPPNLQSMVSRKAWPKFWVAHDGLQVSVNPGCVQGQGQGQRSRDTGTFVLARKSLLLAGK